MNLAASHGQRATAAQRSLSSALCHRAGSSECHRHTVLAQLFRERKGPLHGSLNLWLTDAHTSDVYHLNVGGDYQTDTSQLDFLPTRDSEESGRKL